ncbi:calsyntenin-1-like [Littorina saxatilis]|uniref:Cadherin domain-containing protein n=1 Tax=Littorina saxatilis TaxID=31220 RepID=A0AAN9AW97_9CAEN
MRSVVAMLTIVSSALAMSEPNAHRPHITGQQLNSNGRPVIHGIIREDETEVTLQHPLVATDSDDVGGASFICGFAVKESKKRPRKFDLPFEVQLKEEGSGEGVVRVKEGMKLDFEKRSHYRFYIVAEDCGSPAKQSERAVVLIKVKDVDEFAPRFENSSYLVEVEEGKIFTDLLQLRVVDLDGSDAYGQVAGFEILTPDVPFFVTKAGILQNTEALDYKLHHNYILRIVAYDGGQRRSKPIFVNILVKGQCRSGWHNVPTAVSYMAGQGQKRLADSAQLHLCDKNCDPEEVKVKVTLTTKHIGKGCDRDTYSITSQRKLCGASGDSVDLLPSPWQAEWTKTLPTDDGHLMDQIFSFDGQHNAVEVPAGHFDHKLGQHFTISTWMKHDFPEGGPVKSHNAPKEHIVCMSDGEGMNRHHYALWVHGEKLVFLLRQEDVQAEDMDKYKPAEFRWHIPQVNDNQWHHYAISVDFPNNIRLYLDGNLLLTDDSNYEEIDDWPLHKSNHVHSTKLVVGACWQGKTNQFKDYFRGYLAGLAMLKGKTESERVIKCLHNCKENLDFRGLADMSAGTVVSFNGDMTEFTVTGSQVSEVEKIVREVTYVNARSFPTPGRRNLRIDTSVTCNGQQLVVPPVDSYVMVKEPPKAVIHINGAANLTRLVYEFELGLRIFHDVHIFSTMESPAAEEEEEAYDDDKVEGADTTQQHAVKTGPLSSEESATKSELLVDMCTVLAEPPLDLFVEHLSLPTSLLENRHLEWSETNDGVVISNADKIENYEKVIRNIHYYHNKPSKLSNRTLTLSCSSQNGRFISNKFVVRLVALHEVHNSESYAHAQANPAAHVQQSLLTVPGMQSVHASAASSTSNFGMAAIIVVCVGFLLFMIILGVVRIRAAHRRTQVVHVEEKQEMEWDNSALNIIVNPVEQEIFEYEDNTQPGFHDDSDTDDDESSMQGDYGESSEDEAPVPAKAPNGDLEWDHSNLGF